MSRMYYVAAEDVDGENQDQFVCANSVSEAVDMFMVEHEIDNFGNFFHVVVHEVPTDTTKIGVVEWGTLKSVTCK